MPGPDEISRYRELLEVARLLNGAMDVGDLLREILRRSKEVMRAEACSVFLADAQTGELVIHSALGNSAPQLNATRIPKGMGIVGAVFETKKTINIHDVAKDPRHYGNVDKKTGFQTKAMISSPLLNGDTCLGVVQILNPVSGGHFTGEDEEIFEGFTSLIASALIRLEAQSRQIQMEKSKQELELAREIQLSFLPDNLRLLPSCQVRMSYFPANEVGGDFYFVEPLDEYRTLIGLGDVSGKGVPAALTMARATAEIRAMAGHLKSDLGEWVTAFNTKLCEGLKGGRFIGITFLLTDTRTSVMQICPAGQYSPLCGTGRGWTQPAVVPQLPIGILPGFPYRSEPAALASDQLWLLFSDGITEARNASGDELTLEGLQKQLPVGLTGAKTLQAALDHWVAFVGGASPHDDASLLLLDWRGAAPESTLEITCCTEELCRGRDFVEKWANYLGYDDITVGQIVLAVDEAATNVYRYAYKEKPGPLRLTTSVENNELVLVLEDQGEPCNPEKIKGRKLDDLRPGGLGTVLLQNVFNEVRYEPESHGTRLTLRKALP